MLIRKLRLQKGWSQETLAELSGLSVRTIQRIEGGQPAGAESLRALSAVLETDLSTLQGASAMTTTPTTPTTPSSPPTTVRLDEALAMAQVRRLRGFYNHAITYLAVNTALATWNLVTQPHRLWFVYPLLGWGIGLASHGLRAFEVLPFLNSDWERRQVEKRLGRRL